MPVKRNLLVLFGFLLLVACGNQHKSQEEIVKDWKTLETQDYSIRYPQSWALNQSGYMGTSFIVISKQTSIRDFYQENVSLVEEDLSDKVIDLEAYVQNYLKDLENKVEHFKVVESEFQKVGNKTFYKVIYVGVDAKSTVMVEQHYMIKNTKAYVLTFSCKAFDVKRYKPIGEAILNSFKLK